MREDSNNEGDSSSQSKGSGDSGKMVEPEITVANDFDAAQALLKYLSGKRIVTKRNGQLFAQIDGQVTRDTKKISDHLIGIVQARCNIVKKIKKSKLSCKDEGFAKTCVKTAMRHIEDDPDFWTIFKER